MADTTYTDSVTLITADTMNDLNRLHYTIFQDPANLAAIKSLLLPSGMIAPFAGSSVPTDWLACDGSAVSRTTYAALFTAISTTWGSGDGSTTFNVPNLSGRVPVGSGTGTTTEAVTASSGNGFTVTSNSTKWVTGMSVVLSNLSGFTTSASAGPTYYIYRASATNVRLCSTLAIAQNATTGSMETISGTGTATLTHTYSARTLGEYVGEESHAMSSTEQLSHTHTQNSHSHVIVTGSATGAGGTSVENSDATDGPNSTTNGTVATNQNTGGNAAANIMQPGAIVRYIIKT